MTFEWELFENYTGSVYVTEIDTNRLVYMNAPLRQMLGYGDDDAYKGRLCYEVLQGRQEPCEFCTNCRLQPGKFITWSYRNPNLERDFVLSDTLLCQGDKRYRMEFATDLGADDVSQSPYYAHSDQILSECLQLMFSKADENQAIDQLLQYIGETFACERVYIFELADQKKVNNTYEWCAEGVEPQIGFLQNVPYDGVAFWFDIFDKEGALSIAGLEDIRESHPLTYAYLQPQHIRSLMVGPIRDDKGYVGFIGADNPDKKNIAPLSSLIRVIGYFVSTLLKRRDLTNQLRRQSHFDPLTGAFNRNALMDFFDGELDVASLGIVYCDISGLKQVNDQYGHAAGDELIRQSYRLIAAVMEGSRIYRIGGDEFVVVCPDLPKQEFLRWVDALREKISTERYHIAVGSTWTDSFPVSFSELLKKADREMYRDKQQYYSSCSEEERRSRDRRKNRTAALPQSGNDIERMLPALSAAGDQSYVCVGNYQSRYYAVSDGMKKKFGFSNNIVYDLISQWEDRIIGDDQKKLFRKRIEQALQEKQPAASFACTMQDCDGNVMMVRGTALIQWDEAYTEPITLLASAHIEKNTFLTDPITAFPTVQGAAEELANLKGSATVLLFKLNHFGKINESKGRETGNQLLKNIATELREYFCDKATFFRLDGLKFMGVHSAGYHYHQEFIDAVREIVIKHYKRFEITVPEFVTFMPIEYSSQKEPPMDLLQNSAALLSAAEFNPVPRAIKNSASYLNGLKKEIDMEFALAHDIQNNMANFRIVVQPTVCANARRIIGGEVLLRWTFRGKDVSPGVFIPLIERGNLMSTVGTWVLEQTVQCCRSLAVYRTDLYLSFNVSYQQILTCDFAQTIRSMLQKYKVSGEHIVAELTETHEDEAPLRLQKFIDACEEMGVRIALDDFGNGYSSLGLLLKYSAQIIKLDRSILRVMATSDEKEKFVCGLVESCHRLNKVICMEGVETEEELAVAQKVGCDMIQGFYYYRPMELADLFHEVVKDDEGRTASPER